jgi:hypothetical protein
MEGRTVGFIYYWLIILIYFSLYYNPHIIGLGRMEGRTVGFIY